MRTGRVPGNVSAATGSGRAGTGEISAFPRRRGGWFALAWRMPGLIPLELRARLPLLALPLAAAGCEPTQECSDVYCSSETALLIDKPQSAWADGRYTLDLRLGDRETRCSFTLPIPGKLPHELQLRGEPFDCTPALPAHHLGPLAALHPAPNRSPVCPQPDGGPPLASCPPLAGRYHIEIHTSATGDELGLRLESGGTVLLQQSTAVDYTTSEPNGPECGPTCSVATLTFRITEPP